MTDTLTQLRERAETEHAEAVARGEHDEHCEWRPEGFYLCHCSKRARIAAGYTEPPGELIVEYPTCPRCWRQVDHDGDRFRCYPCRVSWSSAQHDDGEFTDDYGDDLATDLARWEAARVTRTTTSQGTRPGS